MCDCGIDEVCDICHRRTINEAYAEDIAVERSRGLD